MTPEQVARRYQTRPGYRLADYADVALPVYVMTVRALILAHKQISPIEEFILKSIDSGLKNSKEIAGFLGLQERIVEASLFDLASEDATSLAGIQGSADQMLRLTAKGKKMLATAETVEPEERPLHLFFDAITRTVALYGNFELLRFREITEHRLMEIPVVPPKRPQVSDLKIQNIQNILRSRTGSADYRKDLLAIKAIDRIERRFIKAIALVYKAEAGHDVQLGFAIDGKISEEHERAFAQSGGAQKLRLESHLSRPIPESREIEEIVSQAAPAAVPRSEIERLEKARNEAEAEVLGLEGRLLSEESVESREATRQELESARDKYSRSKTELDKIGFRFIYVHEHPELLRMALEEATVRLMINTPWIRRSVVDDDFLKKLHALLQRNVQIYIGWGLGHEEAKSDEDVLSKLEALHKQFSNLHVVKLGDTHAKVLLKDRDFAVVTSFNWLSFKGDPSRTFRDEQGAIVHIPELVDQKFDWLLKRFDDAQVT